MQQPIVITPGEPAGIGPDIVLEMAMQSLPCSVVAIADIDCLKQRAELLNINIDLQLYNDQSSDSDHMPGKLNVVHYPLKEKAEPGKLNPVNADYVLQCIKTAVDGCLSGKFSALVTGPVHKGVINTAGVTFTGHTELLGELTNSDPVMMLTSDKLRVVLLTTHLPLAKVPAAITKQRLQKTLTIVKQDLQKRFHINNPVIYICGLNPHAGEQGHLGKEEQEIIEPAINELQQQGFNLVGPLSADTLFLPKYLDKADAILAMYHDQGLPVIKALSFGKVVNVTLGLPIIRTSVDHGTALSIAGTGKANIESLLAAIILAADMIG